MVSQTNLGRRNYFRIIRRTAMRRAGKRVECGSRMKRLLLGTLVVCSAQYMRSMRTGARDWTSSQARDGTRERNRILASLYCLGGMKAIPVANSCPHGSHAIDKQRAFQERCTADFISLAEKWTSILCSTSPSLGNSKGVIRTIVLLSHAVRLPLNW